MTHHIHCCSVTINVMVSEPLFCASVRSEYMFRPARLPNTCQSIFHCDSGESIYASSTHSYLSINMLQPSKLDHDFLLIPRWPLIFLLIFTLKMEDGTQKKEMSVSLSASYIGI